MKLGICEGPVLVAVALLSACSPAIDGWRPLTAGETAALDRQSLAQNPWLKTPPRREAVADFDGDGRQDRALVRIKGDDYAIFVIGAEGQARQLGEPRPRGELANIELGLLRSGVHSTFCGRHEPAAPGCRPSVTLSAPGVGVTTFEAAQVVYFWYGSTFDVEALSD